MTDMTAGDQRSLRRVLNQLKAISDDLPDQQSNGDPDLKDRYNTLVDRVGDLVGEDLSDFVAGDDMITTLGELHGLGRNIGIPGKFIDLRKFRPLIRSLLAELREYTSETDPAAVMTAPGSQVVVNMATGEIVAQSTAGRDSNQRVELQVLPGDSTSLIEALRGIGVSSDLLNTLQQSLEETDASSEARKAAAWGWFSEFTSGVASGAIGGTLVNSMPAVAAAIGAFLG